MEDLLQILHTRINIKRDDGKPKIRRKRQREEAIGWPDSKTKDCPLPLIRGYRKSCDIEKSSLFR